MSKFFALAAFNTAVAVVNAGHAAKRGVVAAERLTPEDIEASKPSTKPNVRIVSKSRARSAK